MAGPAADNTNLRAHDLDQSPHHQLSSAWCDRCTSIGLHPSNYAEISAVVGDARYQEGRTAAAQVVEDCANDALKGAVAYTLQRAADLARGEG